MKGDERGKRGAILDRRRRENRPLQYPCRMSQTPLIRPVEPRDFEPWKVLWDGYNAFCATCCSVKPVTAEPSSFAGL